MAFSIVARGPASGQLGVAVQTATWPCGPRMAATDRDADGDLAHRLLEACGAFARDGARVVGMARLLSDGVSNAYLVDVWTASSHRRQGIGSAMVRFLADRVPGQHIGLQTDDQAAFYTALGFEPQPAFMSLVVGRWLDNDANR